MLRYILIFLIVALIAAFFGFANIAANAAAIAEILFFVFLALTRRILPARPPEASGQMMRVAYLEGNPPCKKNASCSPMTTRSYATACAS
jgi:uncharacterized membrane protein YtjA (UPF0391 family)